MLYFIHGLNGSAAEWEPVLYHFIEKGYECNPIELQEGMNLRTIHFQDYVEKVISLINPDDVLIGHSMGGLIVQKVAECATINAGICICPAPPMGISMKSLSLLKQIRYLPFFLGRIPFRPSFSLAQNHFLNDIPLDVAQRRYEQLKKQSAMVSYEVLKGKIPVDETTIDCPLLFITRTNDAMIPPDVVERVAEKYHSPLLRFPGNHYIFSDFQPIAEAILDFLGSLSSDR